VTSWASTAQPPAVDLFALNLMLASLSTQLVMTFASRRHLLVPGVDREMMRAGRLRSLGIMIVVAVSMGVGVGEPVGREVRLVPLGAGAPGSSRFGAPPPGGHLGLRPGREVLWVRSDGSRAGRRATGFAMGDLADDTALTPLRTGAATG